MGKLGNDDLARSYVEQFRRAGVDVSRFKRGAVANARCLALVTPDAQRTMRTNLGAAMTLAPGEISPADFSGARHAHIEGYLVFNQALCENVLACARAAGCTISLDLSSFEVVHAARDWMFQQFGKGIDVIFANEDEIRALFPDHPGDYEALARELAGRDVIAAVKLGRDGSGSPRAARSTASSPCTCRTSSTPMAPGTPGRPGSCTDTCGGGRFPSAAPWPPSWAPRPCATWDP